MSESKNDALRVDFDRPIREPRSTRTWSLLAGMLGLAVLLAALVLPAAPGLFLAILVPLWFFCAFAVSPLLRYVRDSPAAPQSAFLSPIASRAPPTGRIRIEQTGQVRVPPVRDHRRGVLEEHTGQVATYLKVLPDSVAVRPTTPRP